VSVRLKPAKGLSNGEISLFMNRKPPDSSACGIFRLSVRLGGCYEHILNQDTLFEKAPCLHVVTNIPARRR
jgi:hypothetical protein